MEKQNPFVFTHPIQDSSKIMTRNEQLEKVIGCLKKNQYVSILAPLQTGKTTFLMQVHKAMKECVYIDFENNIQSLKEVVLDLAQKVKPLCQDANFKLKGDSHSNFISFLKDSSKIKGIVFLIDELLSSRELAFQFLSSIRAYYNECCFENIRNPHRFVIAGTNDLVEFTSEMNPRISPFNIAIELHIEDLKFDNINNFIKELGGSKFSEKAISRIFKYTQGHPFLTQYICHHLYGFSESKIDEKLKTLESCISEFKVEDTVNIRNMIDQIWRNPKENNDQINLLRAILNGEEIPFSKSHRAIRNLYLNGCIIEKIGKCSIRNPIYEFILKKNYEIHGKLKKSYEKERSRGKRDFDDYFRKLKNFDGWIMLALFDNNNDKIYSEDLKNRQYFLKKNKDYELQIAITKKEPQKQNEPVLSLLINDGEEPLEPVEFGVRIESFYDLGSYEEQSYSFPVDETNLIQTYKFPIKTADKTEDYIEVFIHIYQDVSLITIMKLFFKIG